MRFNSMIAENTRKDSIFMYMVYAVFGGIVCYFLLFVLIAIGTVLADLIIQYWVYFLIGLAILILLKLKFGRKKKK